MLEYLAKKEKGFTLMELLIAVAIVAVLAGVGVPIYLKLQSGAKATEANANLDGIRTSQEAYKMVNNEYVACTMSPQAAVATIDQDPDTWTDQGGATGGFTLIGFEPNSAVRFAYEVGGASGIAYTAGALGDTDGDDIYVIFTATQAAGAQQAAAIPAALTTFTAGIVAPLTVSTTD